MKSLSFLILLSFSLSAQGQFFEPVQLNKEPKTIVFPKNPVEIDVLCTSKKSLAYDPIVNVTAPVKEGFSDLTFIPDSKNPLTEGTILVSHNISKISNDFRSAQNKSGGDGGGVTQMKVRRKSDGHWEVVDMTTAGVKHKYKNINFSSVGGATNLSGFLKFQPIDLNKPYKIYVSEDASFSSNKDLFAKNNSGSASGFRDTSNYTIPSNQGIASGKEIKRYENMGWMVELDPSQGKAVRKHYTAGRFAHSDAVQSGGAIYMISNTKPSLLYSLGINTSSNSSHLDSLNQDCDLSVYAYNKKANTYEFKSLNLFINPTDPDAGSYQDFDLLKNVMNQALDSGAVMFSNLQKFGFDITSNPDYIFLTENGLEDSEDFFSAPAKKRNGYLPQHLVKLDEKDGKDGRFSDPFGRILKIEIQTNQLSVFMEGGQSNGDLFFSNPYEIVPTMSYTPDDEVGFKEEFLMLVHEKVTGIDKGRNPENVKDIKDAVNEVIWMKYDKETNMGTASDMKRFMIAPKGSSLTSGEVVTDNFDFNNTFTYFNVINTPVANPGTDSAFYNSMVIAVNLSASDQMNSWENSTLGIIENYLSPEPVQLENITMWPNPASQTLHLSKKTNLVVIDINGKVMMSEVDTDVLNISSLDQGVYFVKTAANEVVKIIVQ